MEIKPNLVTNNIRQISNETNVSHGTRVILRQGLHVTTHNGHRILRNFNNILRSGPAKFGHTVARRHVMQHDDYISNKENIDPNIQ